MTQIKMNLKRRFKSKAVQFLYDRYVGKDPERIRDFEEELVNAEIARKVYQLRRCAGLTHRQLARRVGTSALVISRLEDADYDGNALLMLKRIAEALNRRVEIRFVPAKRRRTAA